VDDPRAGDLGSAGAIVTTSTSLLREVLRTRLGREVGDLVPLGGGTDHTTFLLADLVVRLDHDPDEDGRGTARREADLLEALAGRIPVEVPRPVLVVDELGLLVYRRLDGVPLLDVRTRRVDALVPDLVALLDALHAIDESLVADLVGPDPYPLDVWRDEAVAEVTALGSALTRSERRLIGAFADAPVPPVGHTSRLCHHDLGAEHLLVDPAEGRLLGVLDWSDAAWTDPCRDLGRLARDLGSDALEDIIAGIRLDLDADDRRRITFHARVALLEDLAHGIAGGDRRYSDAARAALPRTFSATT
jgi:aminoglycoside phosphotransferase (APT) family kinase protein